MGIMDRLTGLFNRSYPYGDGAIDPRKKFNRKRLDLDKRFIEIKKLKGGSTCHFFAVKEQATEIVRGLKLITPEKVQAFREKFKDLKLPVEGEVTAIFEGEYTVPLIEYGLTKSGQEYLLFEMIRGPRFDQVVRDKKVKSFSQRYTLIKRIADAIDFVHQRGFVHRDICPRNFICNGVLTDLRLFDFGLSTPDTTKFGARSVRVGTPLYMAPEVLRRRQVGTGVDVFGFGVMAYELLAGQHPWGVDDNSSRSTLLFDTTKPRPIQELVPSIGDKVAQAIHRCLLADPEKRYARCKQFLSATGDLKADQMRAAKSSSPTVNSEKGKRDNGSQTKSRPVKK